MIIHGDTFSFAAESLKVTIGGLPCMITSVQYTAIQCRTSPSTGEMMAAIQLHYKDDSIIETECAIETGCYYNYSDSHTPQVETLTPGVIASSGSTVIEISGWGFSDVPEENIIYFDDIACPVQKSNETSILCELRALPAGTYSMSLQVCNMTNSRCFGNALVSKDVENVEVTAALTGISPSNGSIAGGTLVTISGYGFNNESSSVTVSFVTSGNCIVIDTQQDSITCVTAPSKEGVYDIEVLINGLEVQANEDSITYEFTSNATSQVLNVTPSNGQLGDLITLLGERLGNDPDLVKVFIGNEPCLVKTSADNEVSCQLGVNFAGEHKITVTVEGMGNAIIADDVTFTYNLVVSNISSTSGSIAGQNTIVVFGSGFNPSDTTISICGQECTPTPTVPVQRRSNALFLQLVMT